MKLTTIRSKHVITEIAINRRMFGVAVTRVTSNGFRTRVYTDVTPSSWVRIMHIIHTGQLSYEPDHIYFNVYSR